MTAPVPGTTIHNDWLLSEAKGMRSRKDAVVTSTGTAIKSGTILESAARANAFTSPKPGNTGTGTMGAVTVSALAIQGTYRLVMTGSGATAAFKIIDPKGVTLATTGAVASAYAAHGLAFTLADGTPDFAAGDEIAIVVDTSEKTYTAWDGTGTPAAILYNDVPHAAGDYRATVLVRDCEVARAALIGLDNVAETALEALGIIVCGKYSTR